MTSGRCPPERTAAENALYGWNYTKHLLAATAFLVPSVTLPDMLKEGENWSLEYDDGVVIGVFDEGMPLEAFGEEAYPAFEAIIEQHRDDIVGTADLVRLDNPFGDDILEIWEEAATESAKLPNYQRAALVADGIKKLSLRNKLNVPGAEFRTFEDHGTAIRWARGEDGT